jgi:hypothetical protein
MRFRLQKRGFLACELRWADARRSIKIWVREWKTTVKAVRNLKGKKNAESICNDEQAR